MRTIWLFYLGIAMSAPMIARGGEHAMLATVWFGTGGDTKGIYRAVLDLETGKLGEAMLAAEINSPGFLTVADSGERLYSLGQIAGTAHNVAVFTINTDRESLELLATADSGGGKPTHLALSRDQGTLLLAHYGGGSVASMPLAADGRILAPASRIQHSGSSQPHPHWIGATPDNKFVLVPDLGLDEVVIYRLDAQRHTLARHGSGRVPPGSGPRHLKFHPRNNWVYVLNELGLTVTAFHYDADEGSLSAFQTVVALPASELKTETSASEIRIHPNGKFLYAGLRGHDVIAVFSIDDGSGTLSLVEREPIRGSWPRNFGIDPTGRWLLAAGAESSTVAVFRIEQATGRLFFTRNIIHVPSPICVEFLVH